MDKEIICNVMEWSNIQEINFCVVVVQQLVDRLRDIQIRRLELLLKKRYVMMNKAKWAKEEN